MTVVERSVRWGDLAVRVASAGVLAPLGLLAIWSGGTVWAAVLTLIVAGLGAEWAELCGVGLREGRGLAIPAAIVAAGLVTAMATPAAGLFALALSTAAAWVIGRRALAVTGIPYVGIAYIALLLLRGRQAGLADVLMLVLVVWGCDIGAYLVGRLVGGPRLAPLLSPGKTWSGAVGGLVCGTAAGTALACGFGAGGYGMLTAAGLSALLSILAQVGDLLESALKRRCNKKDSGWLIPGHGGLLDRLDGLIAAAPAAWLLSLGAVPGKPLWDWGA